MRETFLKKCVDIRRKAMIGGHILHGGDYNPEQWLECPEILEEDISLMKEAGVNCVTLGGFFVGCTGTGGRKI